jgi:hypothetical protein
MQTLSEEEEAWLTNPEKLRQELIESAGPTTLVDLDGYVALSCHTRGTFVKGLTPFRQLVGTLPTAEQKFAWSMDSAKENHNRWWAKCLIYEGAGWPDALDKKVLRMHVHDFEQERSYVMGTAEPDMSEEQAENKFYMRAAGPHGV